MNGQRVAVLGGAGFLGSHLCERLLADGAGSVISVDNLVTGSELNLRELRANARFRHVVQDICDPFDLDGPIDVVFNLASPASPIDYAQLPLETLRVGARGTEHGLELARRKGAVFFQASTSEVYGDPLVHPQVESYWGNVNPVGPRSVYDESKRYAEALVAAYRRTHGLPVRIVRIFNTYGPRMRLDDGRVVPAFVAQALAGEDFTVFGDGSQTRSFCYVTDLVDGFVRLALSDVQDPVNLGNPEEMTILQFAEAVREAAGGGGRIVHRPLPKDDPQRRRPDITRARELLGWSPATSLTDGLRQTIAYFRGVPRPGARPEVRRVTP
jgi:dTDP-glucose 4,6-dehydratase